LFWFPTLREWRHPRGQFSGLVVIFLFAIVACLIAVIAIVAAIRKPRVYAVGLALVSVPALWFGFISASNLALREAAPSSADQAAGRGYFAMPADRALADAIVAGDAAKVASLAPAANLGAEGWGRMTFMRLALENGHASHDVHPCERPDAEHLSRNALRAIK
jgi:hypothetical protein